MEAQEYSLQENDIIPIGWRWFFMIMALPMLCLSVSPRNTTISVHPSTRLQEGGAVTMTCSSEGLPAPEIFWGRKLDNEVLQLLSGNATLTLIAMRMEDSGVYVCEGVNLIGRDKAEVELVVQGE